jgi:hypothetical protein
LQVRDFHKAIQDYVGILVHQDTGTAIRRTNAAPKGLAQGDRANKSSGDLKGDRVERPLLAGYLKGRANQCPYGGPAMRATGYGCEAFHKMQCPTIPGIADNTIWIAFLTGKTSMSLHGSPPFKVL